MRRRHEARILTLGEIAPLELRRCPWTRWDSPDRSPQRIEEWLRDRQRWRDTHADSLPPLAARDRLAVTQMDGLNPQLVRRELDAVRRFPRTSTEESAT